MATSVAIFVLFFFVVIMLAAFGVLPGTIPFDVISIIMAVIVAAMFYATAISKNVGLIEDPEMTRDND